MGFAIQMLKVDRVFIQCRVYSIQQSTTVRSTYYIASNRVVVYYYYYCSTTVQAGSASNLYRTVQYYKIRTEEFLRVYQVFVSCTVRVRSNATTVQYANVQYHWIFGRFYIGPTSRIPSTGLERLFSWWTLEIDVSISWVHVPLCACWFKSRLWWWILKFTTILRSVAAFLPGSDGVCLLALLAFFVADAVFGVENFTWSEEKTAPPVKENRKRYTYQ